MKLIDISEHQGLGINFEALKSNVDGVIIRAGYGKGHVDKCFHHNASECNRLKIPCGAYWFSYAKTVDEARLEAIQCLQTVRQHTMEYPIAFDYEDVSVKNALESGYSVTPALVREMTEVFCSTIKETGYCPIIYTNPSFINQYLGTEIINKYYLWLADWGRVRPSRSCAIWQYGLSQVNGYSGNVDTNYCNIDFPDLLRRKGLNNLVPETPQTHWYDEAMQYCKEKGIMDGTRPTDTATRAEVAQMFYNYDKRYSGLLTDD